MPFLALDEPTVVGMINVNILAATVLCHSLLPKMKEKGKGAIINISSIAAYFFAPYLVRKTRGWEFNKLFFHFLDLAYRYLLHPENRQRRYVSLVFITYN